MDDYKELGDFIFQKGSITANPTQEEDKVVLEEGETLYSSESGGHRTVKAFRADLIPHEAITALGETLGYGEFKYGRLFVNPKLANWKGLDITTDQSPINHAIDHLYALIDGDTSEDHLGHALANLAFMAWFFRSPDSPYYGMTYPEILALRPGPKGETVPGLHQKNLATLRQEDQSQD